MKQFRIMFGILILACSSVFAGVNETLPSHHWAYRHIAALQNRGLVLGLNPMHKPYTRGRVAEALAALNTEPMNSYTKRIAEKLIKEFKPEIDEMSSGSYSDAVVLRGKYEGYVDKTQEQDVRYRGIIRGGVGAQLGKHVFAFSGVNFDQYDYNDPAYRGYKWRGFAGYTEQAYIRYASERFDIVLGRDFLSWGPGRTGTLVFSNQYRPLDQIRAKVRLGPFEYMFIASELDNISGYDSSKARQVTASRFLSAHRLEAAFMEKRVRVAVSEIVVYGGEHEYFNTVYMNPVIFYHGAKKNGAGNNNVLPTVDVYVYPKKNIQVYGSILIDDIQVEKTCPGDLEPNEIGIITGALWSDPFNMHGMTVSGEYVRVTNRTYKTPHFPEVFLFRSKPLGHPLGNDFDLWQVSIDKWFSADLRALVRYTSVRHGEGSIYTPWDQPWYDYTVEQGYSEPFPTGVVAKRGTLHMEARYQPGTHWGIHAELDYSTYSNYMNQEGVSENKTLWRVGAWWNGDLRIRL